MILWLNGKMQSDDVARIAPNDRGFLLGDGLFETFLVRAGDIIQLQDHLERLRDGMAILGIETPYDDLQLTAAMDQVLAENDLSDASMRLTVTRGVGPRGLMPADDLKPTVMITVAPYIAAVLAPARLMVSRFRRNEHSPLCHVKALNYLDNIMALREARAAGFDDAIMLNSKGNICCATAANIFMRLGDKLITPALSEGALSGITRKSVMAKAASKGLFAEEDIVTLEDLKGADEIFITNSLIGKYIIQI